MGLRDWIEAVSDDVVQRLLSRVGRRRNQRDGARTGRSLCIAEGLERRVFLSAGLPFSPQVTFAAGNDPEGVAILDVNGDGRPDLAVTNFADGTLSVLLGNGNGTFQARHTLATAANPTNLVAADVNGDKNVDLIVAQLGGTVGVLLSNGDGTFKPEQNYNVGDYPTSVAVADVSGDGIQDLIVADGPSNTVGVLVGNGDGTFKNQVTYATGAFATGVAVADVDGDQKLDLVVANVDDDNVSVLLGNGNGTFQPQQTFAVGSFPKSVASADLNGHEDLVLVTDLTLTVMLGNGNGTFATPQTYAAGSAPSRPVIADVNGDGKPDIAVPDGMGYSVNVLLGNGDGTFQARQSFATGGSSSFVAVSDINGDGKPDLAVSNFQDNNVSVILNGVTTTSLARSSSTITFGHPVTFTATVTSATGGATPTGTVTFFAGATQVDAPAALSGGVATLVTSDLPAGTTGGAGAGTDSITAHYDGDNTYGTSASAALSETINPVATTTTIDTSDASAEFGAAVTFTASVAPANSGDLAPTGSVIFSDDNLSISGSVPLVNGVAQFSTQALGVRTHHISAAFSGPDPGFATSASLVISQAISQAPTATTVVSSFNPSTRGEAVTFTATVAGTAGALIPTGTVTFFDGATQLGSPVALSNGIAALTPSPLPGGNNGITADYSGDADYLASNSSVLTQTVNVEPFFVTLTGSGPSSVIATTPLKLKEKLTLTDGADPIRGTAIATILLSSDENAADSVFTLASASGMYKLNPGKKKTFQLKLPKTIPSTVPAGTYHILIHTDNLFTVDSGQTLTIVAAKIDLTGTFVKAAATEKPGKSYTFTFDIQNLGNVTAHGKLMIETGDSPDGKITDLTAARVLKIPVRLAPMKVSKHSFTAKAITPGTYFVVLDVDPSNAFGDSNLGNNVFSTMITVA